MFFPILINCVTAHKKTNKVESKEEILNLNHGVCCADANSSAKEVVTHFVAQFGRPVPHKLGFDADSEGAVAIIPAGLIRGAIGHPEIGGECVLHRLPLVV